MWSAEHDYNIPENLASDRYLPNDELNKAMADLQEFNPAIAQLQASNNIAAIAITSLKITNEVSNSSFGKEYSMVLKICIAEFFLLTMYT